MSEEPIVYTIPTPADELSTSIQRQITGLHQRADRFELALLQVETILRRAQLAKRHEITIQEILRARYLILELLPHADAAATEVRQ